MAKARRRKDTQFETSMTKSVFLYGSPNKYKSKIIRDMQNEFTKMVNGYIRLLAGNDKFTLQIVKNDKKDSDIRKFEKSIRPEDANAAFSQNAFDMAVTHLSNRMDNIRQDMYAEEQTIFTSSKVLFTMSIDSRTKSEMLNAMKQIASKTKKDKAFYEDCISILNEMSDDEFIFKQAEFMDMYISLSTEYRIPELKRAQMPLDSRLMKIEKSTDTAMPYVIKVSDALHKNTERVVIPINTSRHSANKIKSHKMAGTVMASLDENGILQVGWSYESKMKQPKTSNVVGVDVGISDTLHTSEDEAIGSMKPVIDFYHDTVEKSFASLSDIRNKKRSIGHYLQRHKNLPEDVRRSLIKKIDRLDHMIQKADTPYRKKRCYYEKLDHEIKTSVDRYIESISHDTMTVLEKLDIREFNKSRKSNGMMSTFARGKLQKRLMETLNWYGYDFKEIIPDYTSQVCPKCSHLEKDNRNGKFFKCKCCGYEADSDYVGSLNIKARVDDQEIQEMCEKYKYKHSELQKNLKMIYKSRNDQYKAAA